MQYPQQFWDDRYGQSEYVYGTHPNDFFKEQLEAIPTPGKLLLLAEGEGRNAVFAAEHGWQVTAVDFSENGKAKATALAESRGLRLDYHVGDVTQFDFEKYGPWDVIGLIYSHFPADVRAKVFPKCLTSLRPGGQIILELFTPEQLNYTSGGPKDLDLLYTADQARTDFAQAKTLYAEELVIELDESKFHRGPAAVVRCVATF
ncbi:MAG: methyltransferase domain-containing protein [Bacteroidetes bacterium]|nr:methyltransferase domain-containing protein [Bacteroidota bacterium]